MAVFQPVVFKLDTELYGIDIAKVNAIEHGQEIVRVPNSSGNIKGIINLRGEVIPVVNMRTKFKISAATAEDPELIIVNTENRKIALEVDDVEEIHNIDADNIVDMPTIAKGEGVKYFDKVAKVDGKLIIMIKPEELLSSEETSIVASIVDNE